MSPLNSFVDINALTNLVEPLNQPEQSESLNNDLEQLAPFVDTHQGSEPANNFLGVVAPEENNLTHKRMQAHIDESKKQLTIKRNNYIKGRIGENRVKVVDATQNHFKISNERRNFEIAGSEHNIDLLAKRMKATNDYHSGILSNFEDGNSGEQRFAYSRTLNGLMIVESSQHPIQLPRVEKLPKYCTWVFLAKNQRMTEEQTIANRRGIYYDQDGEVCVISDSDSDGDGEKMKEEEKNTHFTESEDYILRTTVQEFGLSDFVAKFLGEYFSKKSDDVQARYEYLLKGENPIDGESVGDSGVSFEKDLDAAVFDTFNKLFCRRCLIFDCKLHGYSQELIFPAEKHLNADSDGSWELLEKSMTGSGIFGRNCSIIENKAIDGLKTCFETFMHMNNEQGRDDENADVCDPNKVVGDRSTDKQVQKKSRFRQPKYKPKSFGYPLLWNRIGADDKLRSHYSPCHCQSPCGEDCNCAVNLTTCEKYCGCPRSCKNRHRGCYCGKGQCRSRSCPCFAAFRECDPDVCRNCWISCGDGTLGAPAQRGENDECRNMGLLRRQHKKIALGRSSVNGWGAFLMCDVEKDELLGEYTGEVISHYEADKRGKRYDRINKSYIFDLNTQWVLDSFGVGSKLKFANHSSNPNCYAKIILVAGDHRLGIYSKEAIKAGEEIFYNYHFKPDSCPEWAALGSSSSSSKKIGAGSKKGAARKRAL